MRFNVLKNIKKIFYLNFINKKSFILLLLLLLKIYQILLKLKIEEVRGLPLIQVLAGGGFEPPTFGL